MARCQSVDIRKQYKLGVRCFDLRIRYNENGLIIAHGIIEYDYSIGSLIRDLEWLNEKGDCYVRLLFEARNLCQYNRLDALRFRNFCKYIESYCNTIHWWCGRNLYNWIVEYDFGIYPTCEEKYGSVSKHKWLYAWWPWLYAKLNNRKIRSKETDKDILLIDYVGIK